MPRDTIKSYFVQLEQELAATDNHIAEQRVNIKSLQLRNQDATAAQPRLTSLLAD
jgi:hypothetical protein